MAEAVVGQIIYQGQFCDSVCPPTARPASARVSGNGVELTVYVSVAGKGPTDVQIQIPMTSDAARQLLSELRAAALEARKTAR